MIIAILISFAAMAQDTSIEAENDALRRALDARTVETTELRAESDELKLAIKSNAIEIESLNKQLALKNEIISSLNRQLESERAYSSQLEERRTDSMPKWARVATTVVGGVALGYIAHDIVMEVK